jgi:hypothetical protein
MSIFAILGEKNKLDPYLSSSIKFSDEHGSTYL